MSVTALMPKTSVSIAGSLKFRSQPEALTLYTRDESVYSVGDSADCLFKVKFGLVRQYRILPNGRRQISCFHMPGEVFGFETNSMHVFYADAVVHTGLAMFEVSDEPQIASAAIAGLVHAQQHLLVVGQQNAVGRIAAFLIEMSNRQGGDGHIDLPMPRSDIGDYLGLTVETVSRIFSKLKNERVIVLRSPRAVYIQNIDLLETMAASF